MKKTLALLSPILVLSLASCGGVGASSANSSSSSSALSSSSSSSSTIPLPSKADFTSAILLEGDAVRHYTMDQRSYKTAFDANMIPIEGKYTVSSFLSDVSLYDDQVYLSKSRSLIYSDPVTLLAPVSGEATELSSNDYYVKDAAKTITSIDDSHDEAGVHRVAYSLFEEDLIHSFSSLEESFSALPMSFLSAYVGGKSYFDGLVANDPENYIYDDTDPFVENPVALNSDGSYTYSFSVHFSSCHYGDYYYINRRFHYFIDLNADYSLKDYGLGIEVIDPLFDSDGNLTGYAPDAGEETIFSAVSAADLGNFKGTLPDLTVAKTDESSNDYNADGALLQVMRVPHPSFDMTSLTSASLQEDATLASLSAAMPAYLSWATSCTMEGILTNGDAGAVYEEHKSKTLYTNDLVRTTGTLKASPITETSTTDETTEETTTTYSYGPEEDVTYSTSLQLTAKAIVYSHEETESTAYHADDPLDGKSPVSTFALDGDYKVPSYLAWSEEDYLNPSMLLESLSLLAIDKTASSLSEGVLTLKANDGAADYLITIAQNKITKVVETPSALNTIQYGKNAVVTKTYVLSDPTPTAYQA
jgi:hypothetical protein